MPLWDSWFNAQDAIRGERRVSFTTRRRSLRYASICFAEPLFTHAVFVSGCRQPGCNRHTRMGRTPAENSSRDDIGLNGF